MRKSVLAKEMDRVILMNERLNVQCRTLLSELDEKNAVIETLTAELEELKRIATAETGVFIAEPETDTEVTEVPQEAETTETEPLTETRDFDPVLPETALKMASEVIGRVVLKCAEVCNTFAAASNMNSKDLINLALGRTEVFKSDVLSLVSKEELSDERLKAELHSRETAVTEYFDLLLQQM